MSAIEATDLSYCYGAQAALDRVSFAIPPLSLTALIGPNGGGKTTLFKLLLGLLESCTGSLHFSPDLRRPFGYVPQHLHFDRLFPITAKEVVLGGRLHALPWYGRWGRADKERAEQALAEVGMANLASRPFGELSGGQMQRVLIARALATESNLLLLDEPTSNLDIDAARTVLDIILRYRGKKTILLVTHELEEIVDGVDQVLCVQGTVSEMSPREVCAHHAMGVYHRREPTPPSHTHLPEERS